MFACGTAAVITPVGPVKGADRRLDGRRRHPGAGHLRLREELVGIQYGSRPDAHSWVHKIC